MSSQALRSWLDDHSPAAGNCSYRVLLLIDFAGVYGRQIVRGIAKYVHTYGSWRFLPQPPVIQALATLASWKPTGVIGQVNEELAPALAKLNLPVVNVSGLSPGISFPQVCADNLEVGRTVARELFSRGFRWFGYFGRRIEISLQRLEGFRQGLAEADICCSTRLREFLPEIRKRWDWEQIQSETGQWLSSLEKPVGIMAYNDDMGFRLLEACARTGLKVPEQVAVIGVDNDHIICNLATPSLSSVALPLEQLGFQAAQMLDQLMKRQAPPALQIRLAPTGVVIRPSCDTLTIEDPIISQALSVICRHAHKPVGIAQILEELPVSRRNLERRFRKVLRRSPHQEILRIRLDRAKQILRDTDLKVSLVSERSGFSTPKFFAGVFKRATGLTPVEYRKRHRLI